MFKNVCFSKVIVIYFTILNYNFLKRYISYLLHIFGTCNNLYYFLQYIYDYIYNKSEVALKIIMLFLLDHHLRLLFYFYLCITLYHISVVNSLALTVSLVSTLT